MNAKTTILSYDQNFEGFLTAVYTAFHERLEVMDLRPAMNKSALLFNEVRYIPAERQKAQRIWNALYQKGTADLRLVYFAFLSENEDLLFPIYEYMRLLLKAEHPESFKNAPALRAKLSPWAQRVEGEKRKLEAALRLQSRYGEFRCCRLRPLYDVLPLLTRYCRLHFESDPWMLIDAKRRYGLRKRGAGIERFQLSDELFGITENSAENNRQQRESELAPNAVQPLQAAV